MEVLNCLVGSLPILYLACPVGGDPCRLNFWDLVVNCIKFRLSRWKRRHLSFGGRFILLKSVLTSLHACVLSFFKAPSGIIVSVESLLIFFFFCHGLDWMSKNYNGSKWIFAIFFTSRFTLFFFSKLDIQLKDRLILEV